MNDAYGLYLSLGIQDLAKTYNIEATSIAVSYEDDVTYNHAAQQIKDLGVYIVILIIHSTARLFQDFAEEGIVGYPYFYLGMLRLYLHVPMFSEQCIQFWSIIF